MSYVLSLFSENFVTCEIMWKSMVYPDGPQMTILYDPDKM